MKEKIFFNMEKAYAKKRILFTPEDIKFIRSSNLHAEILAKQFKCSITSILLILKNKNTTYYDPDFIPKETIRKERKKTVKKSTRKNIKMDINNLTFLNNLFFNKGQSNEYN